MNLDKMLLEIEHSIPKLDAINKDVSAKSVGWQINHILMVINGICKTLIKSDPNTYKPKFNLSRMLILSTGFIPRGKARAPKAVTAESFTEEDLKEAIIQTKSLLERIKTLDQNTHFEHPYFGDINLKTSQRFLAVHTKHHFKIIRDILK